jgi:flagellar protein FliS
MNNLATYKSVKANSYLMNEILNASPEKLLLKVYDFAIVNAEKKDMIKTNEALQVLINALRYDNEEVANISMRLFRLYQFCQDQMRKNNNEIVKKILTELRETWINAFNQNKN